MSQNRNGQQEPEHAKTEVEPRPVRRQYSAEYKQRILDEIDRAREPGEVGAILRREGLYSQAISKWRQQRARGRLEAQKRGPKVSPEADELAQLKRENERLRKKLARAELIIDVQKKVSQMLGPQESEASDGP